MSAAYARTNQMRTSNGGLIVALISVLCGVLVLLGLYYAAGTGQRHKIALAAAQCEPNLSPSGLPCTTAAMLNHDYAKLTTPAIQQLNADVAAYTASQGNNLTAAETALTAQVTTGTAFEQSLARFPFPPAVEPLARTLIHDIQARIALTAEQAKSSSLAELQSFNARIDAAGAAIQAQLTAVQKALQIRPTVNQEP